MSGFDPRAVVEAKRDGRGLDPEELRAFVSGFTRGEIPDYLASAFLMAAFLRGLDGGETEVLLDAMIDSGESLPLASVDRPKVDKHSTGGVGDTVTLAFAPLAASLGLAVAKLSGRGLGHTGGTLDKLEAIPGFRTDLSLEKFEMQVSEIGCAVASQTGSLVPADAVLYALRDATATVPYIPFIATSVMSKKLVIGTDLILLDVKAGSGAFMKNADDARRLAETCIALARSKGREAAAAVTDMSQPLGNSIGNALDVQEAVEILRGVRHGRLRDLVIVFAAEAASRLLGVSVNEAERRAEKAIEDGSALQTFGAMIEAQGGDARVVDDPVAILPRAPVLMPLVADRSGFLAAVDAEALGRASADLGAGRHRKGDPVDPAVGIVFEVSIGDAIGSGQRVGTVHARGEDAGAEAVRRVLAAMTLADEQVAPPPLVHGWIAG